MDDSLLLELYQLSLDRVREIEETICASAKENMAPYEDYFRRTAGLILLADQYYQDRQSGRFGSLSMEELEEYNRKLYEDISGEAYDSSYASPVYAAAQLGLPLGQLLSYLYMEIRGMILWAAQGRLEDMAACCQTFLEVYGILEDSQGGGVQSVRRALYEAVSDLCPRAVDERNRELLDPSLSFARDIVMNQDLNDLRYLYRYGDYISRNELDTARYLNRLPAETIVSMASTFTEGYRKGFELANVDLSKKSLVDIRYCIGFERVIREAVKQFEQMGLQPVMYRAAVHLVNRRGSEKVGYYGTPANAQCEYDHRCDLGLFLDHDLKQRKLDALRNAYERRKELAAGMAGPAVMEIFGEENFVPVNHPEAVSYTPYQLKLMAQMQRESTRITYQYINGEERSFTIISYPVPAIGKDFEAIFHETIRLNNLDYMLYRQVQEAMIRALDQCERVEICGRDGNQTRLDIRLISLEDSSCQTKFENCLADVNIPLGEIFTSPVLKGTEGRLHVKELYIEGMGYHDLWFDIKDGMITGYGCANFPSEEEGRKLVQETILHNHETLPMGEFAIGTNTVAYQMAKTYHIFDKLKILIAEKTGSHFAFGDTCYSNSEERRVYNPDGKEIVAKDNEISILRKTRPQDAYFGCHTDITLPYDELDTITGVRADGSRIPIAAGGRFVLPGTEELNRALDGADNAQ